jgi:hypothetical protein
MGTLFIHLMVEKAPGLQDAQDDTGLVWMGGLILGRHLQGRRI